uniref:Si:ch211-152c8.2 n=2 Tax=Gasterosteus aculeatus aculeatus TaxID=481459 RepID=A0AAQ4RVU0_GASAC|nr:uncharacterized protein LOC120814824 isoform X2 [Gasterosteus aculeatus aculeatus]
MSCQSPGRLWAVTGVKVHLFYSLGFPCHATLIFPSALAGKPTDLRMSGGVQASVFFLGLPALKNLCCVSLSLQEEDEDLRSRQMKTCRELVLLYSDVLASPALDSFFDVVVVVAIPFYQRGILQVFGQRRSLRLGCPQVVSPHVLQCCLSYSLITRLAPGWNKAGLYLIAGLELTTSEGQLCISVEANVVRLPPIRLEDFDFAPMVLRRFCSDPDSVLDTGGAVWCHVLPSMKRGQIINISRQLPRDGPFRTYRDLQDHWNHLYGYRLPDLAEEEVVYCSVYFRLVGERLFTYPLSCVRLQPVQRCPRAGPQAAPCHFLSVLRDGLRSVCGFPAPLSGKPRYRTVGLSPAAAPQVPGGEQINLSATSSSIRPVLSQLPPPPPPLPLRAVKPGFGSQPLTWQDGAQRLLGNRLMQSQECRGEPPSSSSSSSSSVPPPLPPVMSSTQLVPIFRNKCPSRLVNVALLRLQKQREQLIGRGEERGRVTLPAFRTTTATSSSLVSPPAAACLPPPAVSGAACFNRPHEPPPPGLRRIGSLSPASRPRPGFLLAPKAEIPRPRSRSTATPPSDISNRRPSAAPPSDFCFKRPSTAPPSDVVKHPLAAPPSDASIKESSSSIRRRVESKQKNPRSETRDVEQMARSNQLSRLSCVSLLLWLKGRGVTVKPKDKKGELMLKVMSCLAEA